jgi:hypothetical protein
MSNLLSFVYVPGEILKAFLDHAQISTLVFIRSEPGNSNKPTISHCRDLGPGEIDSSATLHRQCLSLTEGQIQSSFLIVLLCNSQDSLTVRSCYLIAECIKFEAQ